MASRVYICDLPGGTNTSTIQIQAKGTLKRIVLTFINAAVGKTEVSLSSTSQIGTLQPTKDVLFRVNHSATAGNQSATLDGLQVGLAPFQSVYVHQTGAGNLGTVNMLV